MGASCCKGEKIDFSDEVELTHFNLQRAVGKGAFGKVRVVQHKGTQKIYALKYINKAKCIKMKAVENIIQERKLLEEANHPFICNLRFAFQDDENMFMVLDLMLGGDLRFHLDRLGKLTEEMVRYYTAEIAIGIAYLHSKKIVHRDLKPDNVLLDAEGHASITDFNIAVHYKEDKNLAAVAGSMAYMAPEVLAKKGYQNNVDWWSLGVLSFELLYGRRPFRSKTNDGLKQAILQDSLSFPSEPSNISSDARDVLKGFMTRTVANRLGSAERNGLDGIKKMPWFKDLDFAKLEAKEITPPFVPDSKKANFDATHELEELLLEENPLKAKPRKKDANGNLEPRVPHPGEDPEVTKWMSIMEEKFITFDYTRPKKNTSMRQLQMDASVSGSGILMSNIKQASAKALPVAEPTVMDISYHDPMEGRADAVNYDGMTDTMTGTSQGGAPPKGIVRSESVRPVEEVPELPTTAETPAAETPEVS